MKDNYLKIYFQKHHTLMTAASLINGALHFESIYLLFNINMMFEVLLCPYFNH